MIELLRKFRTELMGIAMLHVLVIHAYYWLGINFIDNWNKDILNRMPTIRLKIMYIHFSYSYFI